MDSALDKSKKVNVDINTLRVIYQHYKDFFLPFCIMVISVLLLVFFVIPEFNHYLESKEQEKIELNKLSNLQNTLTVLSNLDEAKLDQDLTSLSYVLPIDKDFSGIINAISSTSIKTSVSLGSFSFVVGELSKSTDISPYPSIEATLKLSGDATSTVNFLNEIYASSPMSEISAIKFLDGETQLKLLFFHKPYRGVIINQDKPLLPISKADEDIITKVSSWSNQANSLVPSLLSSPSGELTQPSSSGSALTTGSPF